MKCSTDGISSGAHQELRQLIQRFSLFSELAAHKQFKRGRSTSQHSTSRVETEVSSPRNFTVDDVKRANEMSRACEIDGLNTARSPTRKPLLNSPLARRTVKEQELKRTNHKALQKFGLSSNKENQNRSCPPRQALTSLITTVA